VLAIYIKACAGIALILSSALSRPRRHGETSACKSAPHGLIESPFVGCRAARRKRRGAPFESDEITPLCACNRRRSRVESHLARFSQSACFRGAIIAARCFDASRRAIDRGSNRETRFLKPRSTTSASDDPEAVSQHVGWITDSSALRLEISPSEN